MRNLIVALLSLSLFSAASLAEELRVYVGTYTAKGKSQGIYQLKLDTATGKLSVPELAGECVSPSYLALGPGNKQLFAVDEIANFNGKKAGAVSSFTVDPASGKLTLVNQQPSGGAGP